MNIFALSSVAATVREKTDLDNYITIALVALLALLVIVMIIRKAVVLKKAAKAKNFAVAEVAENTPASPASPCALAKGSAGKIKIYDVDPKTAAMLMAIVADKTGKPLNELRFISIREVK